MMQIANKKIAPRMDGNVVLMPGVYDETMELLLDAYNYFEQFGQRDQKLASLSQRLVYSCEMSRVTLRLSLIMAWLLARKAVFTGALTNEQMLEQFRLGENDICLLENKEYESFLPPFLCLLLERTLNLYERICRLEETYAHSS